MTATTKRPQLSSPKEPLLLEAPKRARPRYLPGDPEDRERLARMIRVNQKTSKNGHQTISWVNP